MNTLYIVRHGESEANANPFLYITKHNQDIPLNSKGNYQAKKAGQWIKKDILTSLPPFEKTNDVNDINNTNRPISINIICSPYLRTMSTGSIISQIFNTEYKANMLLAEWNSGEQDGVAHIYNFEDRPVEKHFQDRLGRLHYKPIRGESFLDIHTRAGVFVCQQNFFTYQPHTIVVTHKEFSIALHHFLLETVNTNPKEPWANGEVRKYEKYTNKFKLTREFIP